MPREETQWSEGSSILQRAPGQSRKLEVLGGNPEVSLGSLGQSSCVSLSLSISQINRREYLERKGSLGYYFDSRKTSLTGS